MNELELLETDEGFVAMVTSPDGDIHTYDMTWEEFERLRSALGGTQRD